MDDELLIQNVMAKVNVAFVKLRYDKGALAKIGCPANHRLSKYPFGCCSDASIVLKRALEKNNVSGITYCKAIYPGDSTHFWLKWGEYHIDITCQQEPHFELGRLVFDRSHPLFEKQNELPCSICEFPSLIIPAEENAYFSKLTKTIFSICGY